MSTPIGAVVFDSRGTLTACHDIDFHAESLALAAAVTASPDPDDDQHLFEVAGFGHDPGAGIRAIHIPHSTIPAEQLGHTDGVPDAVARELAEIPEIVAGFCTA